MGETLVGAEKALLPEILEMGTLFHYGLAPALLMIGLLLIFARSCAIETAKRLLLAYVISTGVLLGVFFGVFANQDAINSVQKWQLLTRLRLPWRSLLTSKESDEAFHSTVLLAVSVSAMLFVDCAALAMVTLPPAKKMPAMFEDARVSGTSATQQQRDLAAMDVSFRYRKSRRALGLAHIRFSSS